VIVPLDGSSVAENALPLARIVADYFKSNIRIIRVIDPGELARVADIGKATAEFAEYALERAAQAGIDASRCTAELIDGSPASAILADAEKQRAEAIVIASHGRSGFKAAVVGSVADKVVRAATVPVLVVPGTRGVANQISKVLVTLDGSKTSERALPLARGIAAAANAPITLFEAYSIIPPGSSGYEFYVPEALDTVGEGPREYLKSVAREGEEIAVAQGDAATAVVNAAASLDADLVVMAASGKGLAGRLFLGSTTDRVLHSLHRPLLIVRPPEED
jgi:nucleotide-binding universal stress UspA family protein